MQFGLLRRPAFVRVHVEQAGHKIDKAASIRHLLLHVSRLAALSGHRVRLDNVRQRCRFEVLFGRLFLHVVLLGILLERLESIALASKLVRIDAKKLLRLLAIVQHPLWR